MAHDIDLVIQAIDQMLVYRREIRDAEKAEQYGGNKTSFYPSELGSGDRKIVYGFFKDRFPKSSFSGQSARVFDNGDYVHLRYREYMLSLGALLTEEQSLKIEQFDLERAPSYDGGFKISGRYDQIIDLHVIRAYLNGLQAWEVYMQANYDAHEIINTVLDATTGSILEEKRSSRFFPKVGYIPDPMVIDVKSMNEWGYNRLEKDDYSEINGYLDQVTAYEDKLGIHKGGLIVEDKAKNRLKGVPVTYEPGRITGNEVHEGLSKRLGRLWDHVKNNTVPEERCEGANVSKFPCKWTTGQCDFFSHCWDDMHGGKVIPPLFGTESDFEDAAPEVELPEIEELIEYLTKPDTYSVSAIILYLKDFPGGQDRFVLQGNMPEPMLNTMLDYYADYVHNLDYVDLDGNIMVSEGAEAEEVAAATQTTQTISVPVGEDGVTLTATLEHDTSITIQQGDALTDEHGVFNFEPGTSVQERVRADGKKEINCGKCQNLIIYQMLRGAKECNQCHHKNVVKRA